MKAVIQIYKTGELKVAESPPPQLRPGWMLVRNAHSLISAGTEKTKVDTARKSLLGKAMARPDLVKKLVAKAVREGLWKAWQTASDRLEQPMPLGYSCAGQIIEVCGDVGDVRPGDWVACAGSTANHAEIICVPKNLVAPIPQGVATDAAAFATVGAIAMQGVRQAEARLGEHIAVIGLGLIGLLTVQILRASGCRVFGIDLDKQKLALAKELGCAETGLAADENLMEQVLAFSQGYGVDSTIVAAGTPSNTPIEQAAEITREKGKVVVLGLTGMNVPREPFYMKELDLRLSRSYGPGRYDRSYEEEGMDYPYAYVRFTEQRNMACFLQLLQGEQVRLDPIITHRFPIDRAADAYELIGAGSKEPYLGVLLEYSSRSDDGIPQRIDLKPKVLSEGAVRLGVIGAGKYACSYLLPHLRPLPKVVLGSVCTSSGLSAVHVAKKFGFAAACEDRDQVIADSDAVLVATRHSDHAASVVSALQAGKPVFVEKPLAISAEQMEEVIACFQARDSEPSQLGRSLTVGFNRRFAPATRILSEHFASVKGPKQILIRVNAGAIARDHWIHDPQVGGGRLIGEGCHFVDLAVFLCGSLIQRVSAIAIAKAGVSSDLWDDFSINLEMANGSVASIIYTSIGDSASPKERIEVSGAGKTAIIDDFRAIELWSRGRRVRKSWWSQDKGQEEQMRLWVNSLREGSCLIPPEQVFNVHRACFAAMRSIRSGVPVSVLSGDAAASPRHNAINVESGAAEAMIFSKA